MELVDARDLPADPLEAAARFHAELLPRVRGLAGDVVICFDAADHRHQAWQLAVVQELARAAAPARVNAVSGAAGADLAATLAYLADAPGVTGQCFAVDSQH